MSSVKDHNLGNTGFITSNNTEHYLKNYSIGKTIGEGTFGKVKLATHIFTGEKVL